MKPVSTFDNFPTFANAGSRNAPGDAKYALGFVPADTLPAEWINYFLHGSTKGITDLNSAVRSIWLELSAILEAYGITASAESTSQILSVLNKIYPQFATCDTAESTQNKSIAISGNVLKAGNLYVIDMVNANAYGDGTATYPTLSINSGTAYPICDASGNYAKAGSWSAGQIVKLLFTGSRYLMSAGITSTLSEGNQNAPTSDSVARAIANIGASIVGEIKIWPGSTLPSEQWAFCNGAELSRTEYATLFSILGVSWGIGDGVTTFNIPDLRECVPVGIGKNSTDVFDSTETDPATGEAGTQNHDEYTLGQFKDDQLQQHNHKILMYNGGKDNISNIYTRSIGAGNSGKGDYFYEYTYNTTAKAMNGENDGRNGNTTHGKQKGVNYIIRTK